MKADNHRFAYSAPPRKQQGIVLVLCLVFMIALTIIATGSMESTIVEERMAGNLQDYNLAFQAAEAALGEAESWLENRVLQPPTSSDGSTVVWVKDAPDPDTSDDTPWWEVRDATWWDNNAQQISGMNGVAVQPQYVIEEMFTGFRGQSRAIGTGQTTTSRVVHRITARGVGGNTNTVVLLQSTYLRPYD